MKKFLIIGLVVAVAAFAGMYGLGAMGVKANDSALEEIRTQEGVVVLAVSGMT